ncbi:MAG: TIGR04076 family protein [Promethearchaeia archaeon]
MTDKIHLRPKGRSFLLPTMIKIEGHCPVFHKGDVMIIDGPTIDLKNSDAVCIHALFSLGPFITALREGIKPKKLGLSKREEGPAYYQCLDPGHEYTDGGTVLFVVKRKTDF